MSSERIGDENLQRLYQREGVSWQVVTLQGAPCPSLIVNFPSLEDTPPLKIDCRRCGGCVETILDDFRRALI